MIIFAFQTANSGLWSHNCSKLITDVTTAFELHFHNPTDPLACELGPRWKSPADSHSTTSLFVSEVHFLLSNSRFAGETATI